MIKNDFWTFLKTKALPVLLAASALTVGLVATGCGDDEPDKEKERADALSAVIAFLESAKESKNYISVSERSNIPTYTYCADGDKILIDYNGVMTYAVIEDDYIYKIYQSDDSSWHKDLNFYNIDAPAARIESLISKINATPWNDYDRQTKTIICVLDDGKATVKLDEDQLTVSIIEENKTTTFAINDVGTTVVTLPENIIDDTIAAPEE